MRRLARCTAVAFLGALASAHGGEFKFGTQTLTVPDGFIVEQVAGPSLVPRPVEAALDGKGRLYVSDSAGSNDKIEEQQKKRPDRVLCLEDSDGDGTFDKSTFFADGFSLLEGCMWLDGSLYVSSVPSIWKLTDTDGDGTADRREEWWKGSTTTLCGNDLHGPYAGPDGWIYWCKGGFAQSRYERPGQPAFVSRASHIFRARPDGSQFEAVMTGGMDNPIGLAFTRTGERILTCTFFQHPGGGQRDGLIHAIYGGVYGKPHDVLDGHPRTGADLMPVLAHLGPAAPCGIARYDSEVFGREWRDSFFVACFNTHRVLRAVIDDSKPTWSAKTEDFLVSDSADFHPTDVLVDRDGSLLVVDTGGWYKLCCPTSQLYKPDVLGGIYRVKRQDAKPDARGVPDLVAGSKQTAKELREMLVKSKEHVLQRAAAEAVGRLRDRESVPALLAAAGSATDRVMRHAFTYALLEIADREATARGLASGEPGTIEAALLALDQMPDGGLQPAQVLAFIETPRLAKRWPGKDGPSPAALSLQASARWIVGRHAEWGPELAALLKSRLATGDEDIAAMLAETARSPAIQQLLADTVADPKTPHPARLLALRAMAGSQLRRLPAPWLAPLTAALRERDAALSERVVATIASVPLPKDGAQNLAAALLAAAEDSSLPSDTRLAALTALPPGSVPASDSLFPSLGILLGGNSSMATQTAAAEALTRLQPTPKQLGDLTALLPSLPPGVLVKLLPLYESAPGEALGAQLLAVLENSPAVAAIPAGVLRACFAKYPPSIQTRSAALIATLGTDTAQQKARLDELSSQLGGGDIRRGQAVFNGPKAGCAACHAIGYLGGTFGPDLTRIGQIRSERDLLEAVVFPSASFVRSYEPAVVVTRSGAEHAGLLRREDGDGVVLATGPGAELHLPRADIAEVRPGAVSPMPPGYDRILAAQELADLISFLKATRW